MNVQRWVVAAITAVTVTTATIGAVAAHERAEGGLNRAPGIAEASTHTGGPEASGKISMSDLIFTGRPDRGGND
jgi:hypothetical protein